MKAIGTHSRTFHADEALAVYLLPNHLAQFKRAPLIRTRDPNILEKECAVIVDVLGKYNSPKYFDHHQRGFEEVFSSEFTTKLSSVGLVYKILEKRSLCASQELEILV